MGARPKLPYAGHLGHTFDQNKPSYPGMHQNREVTTGLSPCRKSHIILFHGVVLVDAFSVLQSPCPFDGFFCCFLKSFLGNRLWGFGGGGDTSGKFPCAGFVLRELPILPGNRAAEIGRKAVSANETARYPQSLVEILPGSQYS